MKSMMTISTAIIGFLFLCFSAYAGDVAKIGVIDFKKILEESSTGKSAKAEIRRSGKKMKMDLEKRKAGIEKQKKKLKQGALLLNKQTLDEKKRGIRININDFRLLQKKYTKELKVIEKKLIGEIEEEVTALIREIGKSKGYILITEQRTGRVLYAPETIDISDQLIRKYNSRLSKEHTLQTRGNKN